MFVSRKGFHAAYMVAGFVLLSLVILMSATIFISVKNAYEHTEDDARCASQIRIHAAAVMATSDLKAPKVVCPSQRIALAADDDPKEAIADAMVRCWDMWGRGELQLFGKGEGAYCHVCSLITVPGGPVVGLPDYLKNEHAKGGMTYTEYLAGVKEGEAFQDESFKTPAEFSIPTDKPIGVVFYYAKGQGAWDSLKNAVIGEPPRATAVGGATGVAAGIGVIYVASAIGTGGVSLVVTGAVAIVGGAATGAGAGFITSIAGREDLDRMSLVLVRPMDEQDIMGLGCTYAPAANS